MALKRVDIQAESLEEATWQAESAVTEGLFVLSKRVLSNGEPTTSRGEGPTKEEATARAESAVPADARVLGTQEVTRARQRVVAVDAFDEKNARKQVDGETEEGERILSLHLVTEGKSGLLGIGKKPGRYEAELHQPSVVVIRYTTPPHILLTLGEEAMRSRDEREFRLDQAAEKEEPVSVKCENCGMTCRALAKAVGLQTVMVMTPETAMIAARYCDNCTIVVCGRCVGVSSSSSGLSLGERPCPRCRNETTYASIQDLRATQTELR